MSHDCNDFESIIPQEDTEAVWLACVLLWGLAMHHSSSNPTSPEPVRPPIYQCTNNINTAPVLTVVAVAQYERP
jgi:hypothetical protein